MFSLLFILDFLKTACAETPHSHLDLESEWRFKKHRGDDKDRKQKKKKKDKKRKVSFMTFLSTFLHSNGYIFNIF